MNRWFRSSAVRLFVVVAAATMTSAGCSSSPEPEFNPGEPAISLDSPAGGSQVDFPVDDFDLCSPFANWVFIRWAPVAQAPTERGPAYCRWRGEGVTATIADETGSTLAEISHDPRYRPGYAGFEGNRYWVTAIPTSPPYTAHLFLAAGPGQPRRLLHIHVETEAERARSPQPNTSYSARGLAELIAGATANEMPTEPRATAATAPR
jgi:hypothetical protein